MLGGVARRCQRSLDCEAKAGLRPGMTMRAPFRSFKTSAEIMRMAVMPYIRFPPPMRNVEDLLHERGINVLHQTVRFWWHRFGPMFAAEIRKRRIGAPCNGFGGDEASGSLHSSTHASAPNHFNPERNLSSRALSSRSAPPLSPSGAVSARHKGQRSCPCRDRFAFVCQHRHLPPPPPRRFLFARNISAGCTAPGARETAGRGTVRRFCGRRSVYREFVGKPQWPKLGQHAQMLPQRWFPRIIRHGIRAAAPLLPSQTEW